MQKKVNLNQRWNTQSFNSYNGETINGKKIYLQILFF